MKKTQTHKSKAFTIIETLVAIFILSLAITGPLFYVSNTFQLARIARYEMTAYFLATETLESIKYYRDMTLGNIDVNNFGPDTWIFDIEETQNESNEGAFDASGDNFKQCNEGTSVRPCGYLDYSTEKGFHYGVNGNNFPSVFYRYAVLEQTGNPSERKVTVTVGWNDGIITGELDVFEYIYDFNG